MIFQKISQFVQEFTEEKGFFIDRGLIPTNDGTFSTLFELLLQKYKSVFFMNFESHEENETENFIDVPFAGDKFFIFERIQEFDDDDKTRSNSCS
jgi:hypothetical protein